MNRRFFLAGEGEKSQGFVFPNDYKMTASDGKKTATLSSPNHISYNASAAANAGGSQLQFALNPVNHAWKWSSYAKFYQIKGFLSSPNLKEGDIIKLVCIPKTDPIPTYYEEPDSGVLLFWVGVGVSDSTDSTANPTAVAKVYYYEDLDDTGGTKSAEYTVTGNGDTRIVTLFFNQGYMKIGSADAVLDLDLELYVNEKRWI